MRFPSFARKPAAIAEPYPTDRITWTGDYATWADAVANCGDGYNTETIAEHYVRRYEAVSSDVAATIASTAATEHILRYLAALSFAEPIEGVTRILDYGGGYGSLASIFPHLMPSRKFHFDIVETPAVVARSNRMGASPDKRFFERIDQAEARYSLVIFSGTLQYLENPLAAWKAVSRLPCPAIMVGRLTIMPSLTRDRLAVQNVPSAPFAGRFPCWLFHPGFADHFAKSGKVALRWDSPGDTMRVDNETFCDQALLVVR